MPMRIKITTAVIADIKTVWQGFDESLFLALAPKSMPFRLLRFDGCGVGDEVHLRLGSGWLSQEWYALVTEQKSSDNEIYFIDKGIKLPFFLSEWQHTHRIIRHETVTTKSLIVDDIVCRSPFGYLIYPFLWFQFWKRKVIYGKIFNSTFIQK